nr:hypothetical protein [Planctomycetota bacterium]
RCGSKDFYHHGAECDLPLGCAFLDSCECLPALPAPDPRPTTLIHGWRDETVAWEYSLQYAKQSAHMRLHLVDDDHSLTTPRSETLIRQATSDVLLALAGATEGS